jgi:predicted ATPase
MSSGDDTQIIATTHSPVLADLIPDRNLFVCKKVGGRTEIEPFASWGPLGKNESIHKGLDDQDSTLVSERILRGDLEA